MDLKIFIVIGMCVVTYLPRMLPLVFLNNKELPPFIKRFLNFIPYAALGALIFPGIFSSTQNYQSAAFGSLVSIILAFFKLNMILVVMGGILSVYLFELLIRI